MAKQIKPSVLIARANARLSNNKQRQPVTPVCDIISKDAISSKNYDYNKIIQCPAQRRSIKGNIHYRVKGKKTKCRGPSAYGPKPTKTFYQQ